MSEKLVANASAQLIAFPVLASKVNATAAHDMLSNSISESIEESRPAMSVISREEIDAKLETIEVRMDGRVASIDGKVASIDAKIDSFMGRLEEKFSRMDDRMTHIERDLSATRQDYKSVKTTIITTGVGAVLAIVFGVAAFNATVLSNMVASFESGKNTTAAQAEVKRQSEETANLLKQIQGQINAPPTKK